MSIENELSEFLNEKLSESEDKQRNIGLILYYYGFQEDIKPTFDEAVKKYKVGTTKNRQTWTGSLIVESNFRNVVKATNLPKTLECAKLIESQAIINTNKLSNLLQDKGLFFSEINFIGLFRFLHDLNLIKNYEIYSPDLRQVTKNNYHLTDNKFIIENNEFITIREGIKIAKKTPNSIGIARLSFLKQDLGEDFKYFPELIELLKSSDDFWFHDFKDGTYYLLETSKDNTLINSIKKVRSVSQIVDFQKLVSALGRALLVRTAKHHEYPSNEIIEIYLKESKFTKYKGKTIELILEPKPLTTTEEKVVDLLEEHPENKYEFLKNELKIRIAKNISDSTIQNSFFNSPLVHVDESGDRTNFKFSSIRNFVIETVFNSEEERYIKFAQRLKEISKDGTNQNQSTYRRVEHSVLREWLFGDKTVEKCAICAKEYSTKSLIAAHKKKRSKCAENEKRDLNIVMPLCLFGCDYIYEQKYLRIMNGKVVKGVLPESLTTTDKSYIHNMIGNSIDKKWLKGNKSYFE